MAVLVQGDVQLDVVMGLCRGVTLGGLAEAVLVTGPLCVGLVASLTLTGLTLVLVWCNRRQNACAVTQSQSELKSSVSVRVVSAVFGTTLACCVATMIYEHTALQR